MTRPAPAPAAPRWVDPAHTPHTAWCGQGHHCNLAEHRSEPIAVEELGRARAVVSRVRAGRTEHAQITLRVALAGDEWTARMQLHNLLSDLTDLTRSAGYVSVTGHIPPTGEALR